MTSFSLNRYTEPLKGVLSYVASSVTGRPVLWGMPLSAGIELTNCCNLACPECVSGSGLMKRGRGYMSRTLFEKFIMESIPGLLHANLYFQGEPMMHPLFFDFIEIASKIRLTVSTNGHFLDKDSTERLAASSLSELVISLDGMDSRTYGIYRHNGEFDRVINGIRLLAVALRHSKSTMKLRLQFLVNRYNESQIPEARKFASEVDAVLKLKSMQVIDSERTESWLPIQEKFRRYRKENERNVIKGKLVNRCSRLWISPVVTWDGFVVPCCFDKDAEYILGDLNKTSFRDIWYGEKYQEFRKRLLSNRTGIGICNNCTEGLRNVIV